MDQNKKGAAPAPEKKKTDVVKILLILLLLASIGAGGFFVMSHMEKTKKIADQEEEIKVSKDTLASAIKEFKALQLELERLKLENEALGIDNKSLDSTIEALNSEVAKWKGTANRKARDLKAVVEKYTIEKNNQESAIAILKHQKDSVDHVVDSLSKNITTLNDTIGVLKSSNTNLTQLVDMASVLRAENIQVISINKKGKESLPLKPDLKAKSIDKLKVTFNIAENKVAKKTTKQIMLRVVEPNEAVLFDMSTGGGFFMSEGKEIPYTAKEEISFDNTKQRVSFIYMKGSPYKPGNYTIEVYGDGVMIGDKKFVVK